MCMYHTLASGQNGLSTFLGPRLGSNTYLKSLLKEMHMYEQIFKLVFNCTVPQGRTSLPLWTGGLVFILFHIQHLQGQYTSEKALQLQNLLKLK